MHLHKKAAWCRHWFLVQAFGEKAAKKAEAERQKKLEAKPTEIPGVKGTPFALSSVPSKLYTIVQGIAIPGTADWVRCSTEGLMSLGMIVSPQLLPNLYSVNCPRLSLHSQEASPGFAMTLQPRASCRIRH